MLNFYGKSNILIFSLQHVKHLCRIHARTSLTELILLMEFQSRKAECVSLGCEEAQQ